MENHKQFGGYSDYSGNVPGYAMVKSVLTVPLMPRRRIQTGSGPHFDHDRDDVVDPPKRMERKGKIESFESFWEILLIICLWCWASERLATVVIFCILLWKNVLCVGGGGVGGDDNFTCTSTHVSCYAVDSLALPHIRHATLLSILLHFHTYVMLRCRYSCTSTHVSCYAAVDSLALPHMCHATLLSILLHFHTCVMLRCSFSCTSTHTSCYAAVGSLALPHMCHATL